MGWSSEWIFFFFPRIFLMNFSSGAKCQEFTENLAGILVNSMLEAKSFAISSDDASLRCGSRGQPVDNVNVVSYVALLCSVVTYPIEWTLLVLRDPVQGYRSDVKADIRAIYPSSRQQRGQRLWRGSRRHHACGRAAITCVCDCVPLFTRKSVSFVSCQKRAGRREIKGDSQKQILLSEGENWFFLKLKWKWGWREVDLQGSESVRSGKGGKVLVQRRKSFWISKQNGAKAAQWVNTFH